MLKKILYLICAFLLLSFVLFFYKNGGFISFLESMENSTFDIRQKVLTASPIHKHNKDIVVIAIDDASYEYILENYGEWPLRRDIYAKLVEHIESQNPRAIAFDLMFVKSIKSEPESDEALIDVFKKYNNVYTGMNLDDQPKDLRVPPTLPEKLGVKLNPEPKNTMEYTNCRTIIQGIVDSTSNIGMINVSRSNDGVLREMPVYLKYQGKFYPQLGYLIGKNLLGGKTNIPKEDGSVILNWYGGAGTFENIPIYKIIKSVEGKGDFNYDFKNKIVYFGATAASLFDIKTVPVDKVYPGVEVQATYINNILDGSFINKISPTINLLIAIGLSLITILLVFKMSSMPAAFGISVTIYSMYIMFTFFAMEYKHLWIEIVMPVMAATFTFIAAVIIKYLIKSRDFDEQYKLATTDGLTELYNHRYFQEQLKNQISHARRYDMPLSLIMIDIDFFKKFNDTFGHQSGDAVLRQVAFLLRRNVRATDIVCRYGGEEISIILPNTKYEEAVALANKLCTIIGEKNFRLSSNRRSNVTISLGVSSFGTDGLTASDLIESADKRLYNAKGSGRNRVN